jgi:hypothetical protein
MTAAQATDTGYDLLLTYLSALGAGSWQRYKTAALSTALQHYAPSPVPSWLPSVVAENFTALGHAEFAFDTDLDWCVTAPALAGLPARGAVLCGRRTPDLLAMLADEAARTGLWMRASPQELAPAGIILTGAAAAIEEVAASLGLAYLPDAARRLIGCLPTLASLHAAGRVVSPPIGYEIAYFRTDTLEWQSVAQVAAEGAYQFATYRPEYRTYFGGVSRKTDRNTAVHTALARAGRSVAHYDAARFTLTLPAIARLPSLYARVLVLCSGCLPSYRQRTLHYGQIPPEVAQTILRLLQGDHT